MSKWLREQWNDIKGNAKWDFLKWLRDQVKEWIGGGVVFTLAYRVYASAARLPNYFWVNLAIFVISAGCFYLFFHRKRVAIKDEERFPGFSTCILLKLLPQPTKRRKYILDIGSRSKEKFSIYISADNIFTFSFVDAAGEPHSIQVPVGANGVPLGRSFILGCEVGIFGSQTILKVEIDGKVAVKSTLDFRADIGALDVAGSVLGGNLSGEENGFFDFGALAFAHSTVSRQVFFGLQKYASATGRPPELAFRGTHWMRANDAYSAGIHGLNDKLTITPTSEQEIEDSRRLFTLPEGRVVLNLLERSERGSYNIYMDENEHRAWTFDPLRKKSVSFATKASSNRIVQVEGPLKPTIKGLHQIIFQWNPRGGSLHVDGEGRGDFEPELEK